MSIASIASIGRACQRGFSAESLGLIVGIFFAVKIASSLWTAATYDRYQYDGDHHIWRARSGGLEITPMAYNPPVYYLPALLAGEGADDGDRMALLRFTNVVYLTIFYLLWLTIIFPRVLPDRASWSVASILLLALPGYQKLVAMVHPDNLLNVMVAVAVAFWVHLRTTRGTSRSASDWGGIVTLSVVVGLTGLTRPFAAPVVAVMWVAAMSCAATGRRYLSREFLARALVITALIGSISLSWYVVRGVRTGVWGGGYDETYIGEYLPYRATFDRIAYFSSFYLTDLIRVPNRTLGNLDRVNDRFHNRYGNSFFTLLYSETWGDHWLYFSSPRAGLRDDKIWFKRLLFVFALPLIPPLGLRFFAGTRSAATSLRGRMRQLLPVHVLIALFVLGVLLYLYWHLNGGLTPGKNSSVKFIYNAYLYPIAIAIALHTRMRPAAHTAWTAYVLLLFVLALPVALYFPEV